MKILSDNSLEHLVSLIKSSIVTDYNNLSNQPIVRISGTENDPIYLRDLQTGAFILSGVCKPFNGSDESMTANSAITFVNHFDAVTAIQIFYPPYNQIQYFEVYDNTYTSKVVALNNMADKLANIEDGANKYTLPEATADTLGGVKVGSGLEINNGVLSATATGTGNVSSDTINSIVVVDSLPDVEEEGVLYLVKDNGEVVVVNLYPSQTESTQTDGFTVTFKNQEVIVDGSNDSSSVWGWTNRFTMNLEANKTYYLQFENVSGSFDDSSRISNSDGIINSVSLTGYDSSDNSTNLIYSVERTADSIYEKYTFTPTQEYVSYVLSMQVKKYNTFDNWTCSITIAEESE